MKILALQLKRIGDLILTTPALFALRQHYPKAHITLAVEESARDLLPGIDFVDRTMVFSRKRSNAGLWRRLALGRFDLALDFTCSDRTAFYCALSKSRQRLAFKWVQRSWFRALFYNHLVDSPVRDRHTIDHYLDLVAAVGVPTPAPAPIVLEIPAAEEARTGQLLQKAGIDGEFIAVHPGTARLEKYWPTERWVEVIEYCKSQLGLPCVLTGGRDQCEQEQIVQIAARTGCVDLSRSQTLLSLAEVIRRARLVLSVDSAPMHLAAAFQKPQVALFGPTNPFHWHPRHERAVVVRAGGVGKVWRIGKDGPEGGLKPRERGTPMSEISTRQVIDGILAAYFPTESQTDFKSDVSKKIEIQEA